MGKCKTDNINLVRRKKKKEEEEEKKKKRSQETLLIGLLFGIRNPVFAAEIVFHRMSVEKE